MASNFSDAERENLEAAGEVLPALDIALKATDVLAEVLRGLTIPPAEEEKPPASYYARSWSSVRWSAAISLWPQPHPALRLARSWISTKGQSRPR